MIDYGVLKQVGNSIFKRYSELNQCTNVYMDGFAEFKVEISPSVILCFLKTFRSVGNIPGLNNGLSKSEIVNPDVNHHGVTLSEDKDVLRCVFC